MDSLPLSLISTSPPLFLCCSNFSCPQKAQTQTRSHNDSSFQRAGLCLYEMKGLDKVHETTYRLQARQTKAAPLKKNPQKFSFDIK